MIWNRPRQSDPKRVQLFSLNLNSTRGPKTSAKGHENMWLCSHMFRQNKPVTGSSFQEQLYLSMSQLEVHQESNSTLVDQSIPRQCFYHFKNQFPPFNDKPFICNCFTKYGVDPSNKKFFTKKLIFWYFLWDGFCDNFGQVFNWRNKEEEQ